MEQGEPEALAGTIRSGQIRGAGITLDSTGWRVADATGAVVSQVDFPPLPAVEPIVRPKPSSLTVAELIARLGEYDPAARVVVSVDLDYDDYWGYLTKVETDGDGDVSLVAEQ